MTESPYSTAGTAGQIDLSNQFIMAMPGQIEGTLARTVIYICEHTKKGALGLVLNRPTDLKLGCLLERLAFQPSKDQNVAAAMDDAQTPVYFGGPVQTDRGFVLHSPAGDYTSSIPLGDMALTTSRDVLQDIRDGRGPSRVFVTLGYAGWPAGQLESELTQNAWLHVSADQHIIFDMPPDERYPAAWKLLGVDPMMLARTAGHA